MNAHATLDDGTGVYAEINWGKTGVDEVWLDSDPDIYLYAAGTVVDVFRSGYHHEYVGEFRIIEDVESADWFVLTTDVPSRRVARGSDRLRALGALLATFGGNGV